MNIVFLRIIKAGIVLALFTPLIIGPLGLSMSAYPKAVFFRSLMEIIFIFYLFLALSDKKYIPKISFLSGAVFVYSLILIISSMAGINFHRSFFGDPERAEGVILNIHFLLFFIMLISIFKKKEEWINLIKIIVSVGSLSSIIALLQKADVWHFYGVDLPERVSGTISNPDFFSSYIVLIIFLAIFLIFVEKAKDLKFVWLGLILLNCLALFLSSSRASWLAFIIGLIFVLVWRYGRVERKKRISVSLAVLGLLVLLLLAAVYQEHLGIYESSFFWRFYSIFDFSLGSRADIWELGWRAFADRPFLGWGPESFSFVFDKYFKADYLKNISEEIFFDNPHNKIIDLMISVGAMGLICYFLIFFFAFYALYKKGRYSIIFIALLFSYFFQDLFYFDTISTYLVFFFILALISNNFSEPLYEIKAPYYSKIILIIFLTPILLFSLYEINIKPAFASVNFPRNVKYEKTNTLKAAYGYLKSLDKKTIYERDFRIVTAERLVFMLEKEYDKESEKKIIEILEYLEPLLKEDIQLKDRKRNDTYECLARINERIYIFSKDKNAIKDMENILKEAVEFNSQRPEFYLLTGELNILEGNYQKGEELIKKMNSLYPKNYSNETLLYRYIGTAYSKAGDDKKAVENFEKSLMMDYYYKKYTGNSVMKDSIGFAEGLAVVYCRDLNDIENCQRVYKKTIEAYPEYKNALEAHLKILMEKYKNL